jgi:hypothetical protein
MTQSLTEQTPSQIDAQIFANLQGIWTAEAQVQSDLVSLHSLVGDKKEYGWGRGQRQGVWQLADSEVIVRATEQAAKGNDRFHQETRERLASYHAQLTEIELLRWANRIQEEEYTRRGGWTRAYLVDTVDGHVHNTTTCPSWNKGIYATQFHWLTELSGQNESEIVELAGERACTICYASAPVDTFKRPSKLEGPAQRTEREAREARAAVKAARDAEKTAAQVLDPVTDKVLFKSDRAATNAIAERLSSLCWYGESHPSAQEWLTDIKKIRVALAAKGVAYDYDKALASARKRVAREASSADYPKF